MTEGAQNPKEQKPVNIGQSITQEMIDAGCQVQTHSGKKTLHEPPTEPVSVREVTQQP